ncbi:MAG TPA: hypothetical protein VFV95_06850 [Vicinamibacterales bacterium]|nr:hypothetical protein [Vicinamibacterales bacterium]
MTGEHRLRFPLWLSLALVATVAGASAQKVIDRVVARVADRPITLTDIRAARGLGVIEAPAGSAGDSEALKKMIERQLALVELTRFPLREPEAGLVDLEVARMTAFAGAQLAEIKQANGVDDVKLRELARDTLRIRAYLDERFAPPPVSDADAQQYYKTHLDEFRVNGAVAPFEEVALQARAAAAEAGRRVRITRWMENLRGRIDVETPTIK